MADVQEVIKRLIVEAQTRGLDKAAADFERFGATAKQAASTTENSLASTGKSFERLAGSIDPARKQLQLLAKDLATLESGRGRPGVSDEYLNGLKEARTAQAAANIEILKTGPALGQQTAAMGQHAKAAGLAGHELKNLGMQANDAATMLLSGSSAFQVMATQGGQVLQVLQGGGGVTANIKDLGSRLLGLVTPANVAFGAIAAGAAATALAVHKLLEETREARIAASSGLGRFAGASSGDVGLAAGRSRTAGVTLDESREGVLAGLRAGAPSMAIIEQANAIAKQYATTLQMELVPAQKELMAAFADPGKGAEALEQKLKFLDASTKDYIKTLQANGETAKAAQVLMDALRNSMALTTEPVGAVDKAWAGLKTTLTQVAETLGLLALAAPKAIAAVNQIGEGPLGGGARRGSTGAQGRLIREQMGAESAPAVTAPDTSALAGLAAEEQALRQVYNALEPLRQKQLEVNDAIEKSGTAFANQVAVMNAVTVEQRALATQQQVMNDLIDKNVNATLAAAQAEQAAQLIREQAAAASQQKIAAQQAELAMGEQLIAAAAVQGAAGVTLRAGLQEELAIRQAGLSVTDADSQARIANAEAVALQKLAIQDVAQATQLERQIRSQIQMIQLETQMIGANSAARANAISLLQSEQKARELEAQGFEKAAAAVRQYAGALAEAKGQQAGVQAAASSGGGSRPNTGSDRTSQYNDYLESIRESTLAFRGGAGAAGHAKLALEHYIESLDSETWLALDKKAKRLGTSIEELITGQAAYKQGLEAVLAAEKKHADAADAAANAIRNQQIAKAKEFQSQKFTSSIVDPEAGYAEANMDRTYGKGVWAASGYLGLDMSTGPAGELAKSLKEKAAKESAQIATQALQSSISIATRALSKQIQQIQEAASEQLSALSDAAQEAGDALSKAADKRQELEAKLKENEDKRQQRIQNYLAAGPSPFEKNADIFYDPKSRLLFAEQIAGNTDELLVAQLAAAKAQEAAAKDADKNAKAAVEAGEATQKAAEQQVKQLQAQQEQLEMQSELISAGLDIESGISNNVLALIGVIKNELPGAIGDHMSALMGLTGAKAQTDLSTALQDAPLSSRYTATGGATGSTIGGIAAVGGGGVSLPGYGVGGTSLGIRRYARGGEFTVPGSYSAGDRPFVVGLAGQERVTVETPAQQAARRSSGGSGTNIENLIVQMPPATNPIEYLNKRSRPALSRAVRGMARGAR